jgi:hypothetical protein
MPTPRVFPTQHDLICATCAGVLQVVLTATRSSRTWCLCPTHTRPPWCWTSLLSTSRSYGWLSSPSCEWQLRMPTFHLLLCCSVVGGAYYLPVSCHACSMSHTDYDACLAAVQHVPTLAGGTCQQEQCSSAGTPCSSPALQPLQCCRSKLPAVLNARGVSWP